LAHFFRILPEYNLVYARYSDTVTIDDYLAVVEGVCGHPDFHVQFKHLIDLTHLKKIKREYVKVMLAQARIADLVANSTSDILSVVVAPTPVAMEAASLVVRSWDKLDTPVVRRIVSDMTEAEALLGCRHGILPELLKQLRQDRTISCPSAPQNKQADQGNKTQEHTGPLLDHWNPVPKQPVL